MAATAAERAALVTQNRGQDVGLDGGRWQAAYSSHGR